MAQMVYFARKNGGVVFHTSEKAMLEMDGATPELAMPLADFEAQGCLVRIISEKIVIGKTNGEKKREVETETLKREESALQQELDAKDYKVVKSAEVGLILSQVDPVLHQRREDCRSRINDIRARLAALA